MPWKPSPGNILVPAGLVGAGIAYIVVAALATRDTPTADELRDAPEVIALGHAVPVRGKPADEDGPARYRHRVELLDGRTATYVSDRLFSERTCLEVRAREHKGRLFVVSMTEHEGACPTDELRDLTR
jgi:hypothetical protein